MQNHNKIYFPNFDSKVGSRHKIDLLDGEQDDLDLIPEKQTVKEGAIDRHIFGN